MGQLAKEITNLKKILLKEGTDVEVAEPEIDIPVQPTPTKPKPSTKPFRPGKISPEEHPKPKAMVSLGEAEDDKLPIALRTKVDVAFEMYKEAFVSFLRKEIDSADYKWQQEVFAERLETIQNEIESL